MDAQLKQRLTGAVILILLAVLFVPELLRGPREPAPASADQAPASAPGETDAEGAPLRSYEIDLSDEPRTAPADETPAQPESTPTPAPAAAPVPDAAPRGTVAAPAGRQGPADRPSAAQAARGDAPAAKPGGAPAPTAQPGGATPQRGFAVQIGSFASRDTAERLAKDLRGRGFETFVSPVRTGSRQLYRVRVGPVPDRAAAQALAARVKTAGQKGSVVSLQ